MRASSGNARWLDAYFEAPTPAAAEGCLESILQQHAEPLIRQIVRSKLYTQGMLPTADVEDVCSEAIVSLISTLQRLRESPTPEPIAEMNAFVASIAYRACSDHARRRYPEFHRLRNRLRYVLQTERDLALWRADTGDWLCGLRRWQPAGTGIGLSPANADAGQLAGQLRDSHDEDPVSLLPAIFRLVGAPMPFDDLVRVVADCWEVTDSSHGPVDAESLAMADRTPLPDASMERNQWLQNLWKEILELPPKQRAALLLNLRDESGACATSVFVASGAAGLDQIAAALDIPPEEFAELWRAMPLDDLQIAGRLEVTRQQVINLRKCAKERLARRLMKKDAW